MRTSVEKYDVVIAGAGPAGTICALALRDAGLSVALVDKSTFPRDKICGDSIPGPALKILQQVLGNSSKETVLPDDKQRIYSSAIRTASGRTVRIEWKAEACNCKRLSFDRFLLDLVKKQTDTHVYEGEKIDQVVVNDGISLHLVESDRQLECSLVIGCDGANSIVARRLATRSANHSENCIAVRSYFRDVDSPVDSNMFYLLEKHPGYFWIFPLGNGHFNVGIGIRNHSNAGKINIRETFRDTMENNPLISGLFRHATMISGPEGFRLPMGEYNGNLSGERFILAGDAAGLIDPLLGHGIDKAMQSGFLAANQAIRCFNECDFSKRFISSYDAAVDRRIRRELRRNKAIMKLLWTWPRLIETLAVLSERSWSKKLLLAGFYRF